MVKIADIHISVLSGRFHTSRPTSGDPHSFQIVDSMVSIRSATVKFIWAMGFLAGKNFASKQAVKQDSPTESSSSPSSKDGSLVSFEEFLQDS
jgi:hypothetical protein